VRPLIEGAVARAIEIDHVTTLAHTYMSKAHFEIVRGDAAAARLDAEFVVKLSQENALMLFAGRGAVLSACASARLDGSEAAVAEVRRSLAAYIGQGNRNQVPFFQGLLAEIEAERDAEGALTRIDEALTLAAETGQYWSDAFLHRLHGVILLKRDPANPAPAEEAFLTAIAVAQKQKARSFELRAALDLARLYNFTQCSADAHALLACALEGFSPTPEFPEIEQAQTLLTALAS
jgi:predicted ATPase